MRDGLITPLLKKLQMTKFEINCECFSTNDGKHSGQLPHWNFYFFGTASICVVTDLN